MRWTEEHLAEYMQKIEGQGNDTPDDGKESVLQGKIVKYCKNHGYPCLSFKQSRKAKGFVVPGWPDLTIALPEGRTVYIELKAKLGILSKDQKQISLMLMYLEHEWYVCKSYKRFLEIMGGENG